MTAQQQSSTGSSWKVSHTKVAAPAPRCRLLPARPTPCSEQTSNYLLKFLSMCIEWSVIEAHCSKGS